MDRVTQQNAALVEQATAAAQSMQDQAAELEQVVGTFKLESGATRAQGGRHMAGSYCIGGISASLIAAR
jgi:hypothetical protein